MHVLESLCYPSRGWHRNPPGLHHRNSSPARALLLWQSGIVCGASTDAFTACSSNYARRALLGGSSFSAHLLRILPSSSGYLPPRCLPDMSADGTAVYYLIRAAHARLSRCVGRCNRFAFSRCPRMHPPCLLSHNVPLPTLQCSCKQFQHQLDDSDSAKLQPDSPERCAAQ
ncbi:hypothetical protein B0H16DRAFT_548200 [Mycena metata]|uniref:Uncharacterized protein n=1 Tax=Mycena metata TaxID=1033252 RepID=A0AAD7JDC6_9AGAR|nr:hypothetical protein B0H16DRAFT_548200 [Mycena metata]